MGDESRAGLRSRQQEMGENRVGLMDQVLTRTWLVADENLITVSRTSTPFSGDKNALALSFLSCSVN